MDGRLGCWASSSSPGFAFVCTRRTLLVLLRRLLNSEKLSLLPPLLPAHCPCCPSANVFDRKREAAGFSPPPLFSSTIDVFPEAMLLFPGEPSRVKWLTSRLVLLTPAIEG